MGRTEDEAAIPAALRIRLGQHRMIIRAAAETNRVVVPAIAPAFIVDARAGPGGAVVVPGKIEPFLADQECVRSAVEDAAEVDELGAGGCKYAVEAVAG